MGFRDLASLSIIQIFGTGITAGFWFYVANFLEPEQYGQIFFYIGIAGIASSFSLIATQNSLTVFIAKRVPIQSTLFTISLVFGVIGSLIVLIFYQRVDVSILVVAYIINTLAIGHLLGKKDYSGFSIHFVIQKIGTIALGLLFLYIFGPEGIIFALVLSYVSYIIPTVKGFKESKINFSLLRTRLEFISNNYLMNAVAGLNGQIDKIIIPTVLSFAILGNYSLALQLLSVLMILPNIVFKYLLPQDASGNNNKKIKILTLFVSIAITGFGIIVLPVLIENFFPKYNDAIDAMQIMSISVIPWTVNLLYTSEMLGNEKSRMVLISYGLITFTITVGIITLGPIFGITGVAISQLLGQIIGALVLVIAKMKQNY